MKCVTSVSVTPSSLTIREGQWSNAVKAEVCPEDAECRSVKWYSDNTAVATVNTSSGQIYGKSAGTARVYAAAQDGSGKKDYCTVTVQRVVQVDGIALSTGSLKLRRGQRGANHGDGFAVEREQSDALLAERRRKRGDGGRQRLGLCEEGRNDGHHGECAGRQRRQRNLLRDRDRAGIGAENHHLPAG